MSNIFGTVEMSADLQARFKRAENKANVQMSVQMHSRRTEPPVTSATIDATPIPPDYYMVVGQDGARLYAPFEEDGGDRAYDAVTLANYGTYHETVTRIDGPIALQLPDVDQAIRTTVEDSLVMGSPIDPGPGTFEFWMNTTETVASATVIAYIEPGPDGSGTETVKITLNPDGTLTGSVHDVVDAVLYSDDHPDAVNDGAWHHVVAVDTGTEMFLYMDGDST